jgi:hypothetical protein
MKVRNLSQEASVHELNVQLIGQNSLQFYNPGSQCHNFPRRNVVTDADSTGAVSCQYSKAFTNADSDAHPGGKACAFTHTDENRRRHRQRIIAPARRKLGLV